MANPCFGGGGMEGYSLVDGVEAGAHVFEGVVEARRQPLYEFRTSSRQTGNNPNVGACHFVVHEKRVCGNFATELAANPTSRAQG